MGGRETQEEIQWSLKVKRRAGTFVEKIYANDPVVPLIPVARERTKWIIRNFHLMYYNVEQLAISCYLQGLEDGLKVAFGNGFVPPGCTTADAEDGFIGEGI